MASHPFSINHQANVIHLLPATPNHGLYAFMLVEAQYHPQQPCLPLPTIVAGWGPIGIVIGTTIVVVVGSVIVNWVASYVGLLVVVGTSKTSWSTIVLERIFRILLHILNVGLMRRGMWKRLRAWHVPSAISAPFVSKASKDTGDQA